MTARATNVSLVLTALAGCALAVRLLAAPLGGVAVSPRVGPEPVRDVSPRPMDPDSLAAAVARYDPFRVTRRPTLVVYDPVRLTQPPVPVPPKPVLVLVGIVWDNGRDPTALVEGLPSVDGPRPVRQGESIGGLRVKTIKPDRVVITGLDTTWTLIVREPWR
jgi:hypothetical protein